MGGSTFLVGCLPTFATAGVFAPIALVGLRMLQGLAWAANMGALRPLWPNTCLASPRNGNQLDSGYGQLWPVALPAGHLVCRRTMGDQFDAWGWRVPFLFSAVLLIVSVYIRLSLHESPVFLAMKRQGTISKSPLREAFGEWRNVRGVLLGAFRRCDRPSNGDQHV